MEIKESQEQFIGLKYFICDASGREIARAKLFVMRDEERKSPFGLMSGVRVDDDCQGQGYGTKLVEKVIREARERFGCYKLIATSRYSRPKVHELYKKIGFKDYGKEFRLDFF